MSSGVTLLPFDPDRFGALKAALIARQQQQLAGLLAAAPIWRATASARSRHERELKRPKPFEVALIRLGIEADPEQHADAAAQWLFTIDPESADLLLAQVSATSEPVELLKLEEVLAVIDKPLWPLLEAAFGGLTPGLRFLLPGDVRRVADQLQAQSPTSEQGRFLWTELTSVFERSSRSHSSIRVLIAG